jgi:CelD/BcsL family acetyltransferase involved in cellulose biosynthesis
VARIQLQPVGKWPDLIARWQALEPRAAGGFFRSSTFLFCQAERRFTNAQLLEVTQDGMDLALALVGRTGGRLWLNQTGDTAEDSVFIEHNGLLAAPEAAPLVAEALRVTAGQASLVLSGIDEATLAAASGAGWLEQRERRFAPCVALDRLDRPFLETLSANARSQIRRSLRLYGPDLRLARAVSLEQAQAFLSELIDLHQASWVARGAPGAFATGIMRGFHQELIARAWPLGRADLLRITAGDRVIGLLYNLIADGVVHSYQSGFAYSADAREKPGLCCHALAIQHYADAGARAYDLLGGADRYKLTLTQHQPDSGQMLHWATLHPAGSARGLAARARARLRGWLRRA